MGNNLLMKSLLECDFDYVNANGLLEAIVIAYKGEINKDNLFIHFNHVSQLHKEIMVKWFHVIVQYFNSKLLYLGFQLKTNNYGTRDWTWWIKSSQESITGCITRFHKKTN